MCVYVCKYDIRLPLRLEMMDVNIGSSHWTFLFNEIFRRPPSGFRNALSPFLGEFFIFPFHKKKKKKKKKIQTFFTQDDSIFPEASGREEKEHSSSPPFFFSLSFCIFKFDQRSVKNGFLLFFYFFSLSPFL